MKKLKGIICTTTINEPTDAIRKYDAMKDWHLIVVGDKASPSSYSLENGEYLGWEYQQKNYPDLCALIGPNRVSRGRMIAFIEAYKRAVLHDVSIIASIDDDCFPCDSWGANVYVGKAVNADWYLGGGEICFNPLQVIPGGFWARGYPIELAHQKKKFEKSKVKKTIVPLVQCDLCDGQIDIDATARIARNNVVALKCDVSAPFFSNAPFSPINTQNTFIHRATIKTFYANIPFIGRADDIWAGYIFQALHPNTTIYGPPSTLHQQTRSVASLIRDMGDELLMYRKTMELLNSLHSNSIGSTIKSMLPAKAQDAIALYMRYFQ